MGETYCELVGRAAFFSTKIVVDANFGHAGPERLKDPTTGKAIKFNSMVHALNFMSQRGWCFVNAFAVTVKGENVYHYIIRKGA